MDFDLHPTGCTVNGIPLSAFTDWKSGGIDVLAVARLGSFARRGAMQHGFGSAWSEKRSSADQETESAAQLKLLTNGNSNQPPPSTETPFHGFMASCHIVLRSSSTTGKAIQAREQGVAHILQTAVGTSSYSVAAVLHHKDEPSLVIGSSHITIVRVDPATRRPIALSESSKKRLEAQLPSADVLSALRLGRMERLQLPKGAAAGGPHPPIGEGGAVTVLHRGEFVVRYSDTDFNRHTNQLMYITFAVDTLREWVEIAGFGIPNPIVGTDVAEVRIDYLCEVQEVGTPITCTLFVEATAEGEPSPTDKRWPSKVWFVESFVPRGKDLPGLSGPPPAQKIATQGFLLLQPGKPDASLVER